LSSSGFRGFGQPNCEKISTAARKLRRGSIAGKVETELDFKNAE